MEVVVDEWIVSDKSDLDASAELIKLKGWHLVRNTGNADSFVWVKIVSNSPFEKIKCSKIAIQSNARFVELYYVQDSSVEYLTTLRGSTGADKFVFEIEHNTPLQFNQLHLKFLSIKNHSVDQGPGLELKIKSVDLTVTQSSYDVANTKFVARNAGGIRSDSGSSENSDATGTTNETMTEIGMTPNPGSEDNASSLDSQATANGNEASNNGASSNGASVVPSPAAALVSNGRPQPQRGMDVKQMILMGMNKPAPVPNINLGASSPQSNEMLIQLMMQMKSSLLSDIGGLLDSKLLPIANRLDKLEATVTELKNKVNSSSTA